MLKLSPLAHTWIFDVDGTIVKHNGYKIDGKDTLLEGVKEFFATLPKEDKVVLLTSRTKQQIEDLKVFLKENNIRYDVIISDMPMGERILVNDDKPSGLACCYAHRKKRDLPLNIEYIIDKNL
ncbi:MAG: hypothetical protein II972_01565 [Elusimicrobiaceae bacterium]|nr:hypothetical protein [Elusimicrobiaceae bacterium]MBQ6223705.1 hypothetical protein [Campylobacter sp.]